MTNALATVDFHGHELFLVNHNDEPYTPMKPIVDGMGLDWASQYRKLSANKERWVVVMLTMTVAGQTKEVVCMPVRKLPAFFASISVNKVREDIRATIILFQTECDDALWKYWTGQQVQREMRPQPLLPDAPITPDQQCTLQAIVKAKVDAVPEAERHGGMYPQIWSRFKNHFRVAKYDQLPQSRMSEAVAYLTAMEIAPKALPSANADLVALPTRQESLSAALRIKALNPGPGNSGEFYEGELLRVFQDFVKWRKEVLAQVDAMEKEFSAVTSPLFRDVLHKLMADTPLYVTDIGMWAMCESRDDAAKAIRDGVNKWECLFTKAQWFAKTLRVRW